MNDAIDINTSQRKSILEMLKKYLPNTLVWAYGSRVQWTSRPEADLDVVVFSSPDQTRRVSDLKEAFEDSNLPFRVDIFEWDKIPEGFKKNIEASHVVLQNAGEKAEISAKGGWESAKWGDLATLEYGKALRGYEAGEGSFRVFGTNGPIGWHTEPLCSHPTVIVGRKGAYRGIHYSEEPCFLIDTAVYVEPKTEFDMKWAYYQLLTQDINGMDSGPAIPSTSRDSFYHLPVKVPPLPEQKVIAHILATLDDKIELNRRMNETLEAIARTIFKNWFIDFDPVRAKAEGRDTGLPEEIADLFPNSFEDSELGEIPKGWRVATLKSRAANIQYGFTQSASSTPVGPHFLRITDIRGGRVEWKDVPYCEIDETSKAKYQIHDGDIFVARTGASTGENVYIVNPPDTVFASYLVRLKYDSPAYARYVGQYMRTTAYSDYIAGCIGGSAQPNASAQTLTAARTVFPPEDLASAFYKRVRPLDERRSANVRNGETLCAVRQRLLAPLLSGDIDVPLQTILSDGRRDE